MALKTYFRELTTSLIYKNKQNHIESSVNIHQIVLDY